MSRQKTFTTFHLLSPDELELFGGFEYDQCVSITKYTGGGGDVVIPEKIGGAAVIAIMDGAFDGRDDINSITVPDCVKIIGKNVFMTCGSVNEIYLPKVMIDSPNINIRDDIFIFQNDTSDENTDGDFDYELNDDGTAVITACNISKRSVTIPAVIGGHIVTSVGSSVFEDKDGIHEIDISNGITELDRHALAFCPDVEYIYIPASVKSVSPDAFIQCPNLSGITVDENNRDLTDCDGVLYSRDSKDLICVPGSTSGVFVIPDGVQSILGGAFNGCDNLREVIIPDSVTSVYTGAFGSCESLRGIYVDSGNEEFISDKGMLLSSDKETLIAVPGSKKSADIPDSVTEIDNSAFEGCEKLESVIIPGSVTYIGDYAFAWCEKLSDINLPEGLTYIGSGAFTGCESLARISIPEGVKTIGSFAFENCKKLKSVYIPDGIEEIGDDVFSGCTSLEQISIPESLEDTSRLGVEDNAYKDTDDMIVIRYR